MLSMILMEKKLLELFTKMNSKKQIKNRYWYLDIEKLKNVPTILNNLKSNVDKLDVHKVVPVSTCI